MAYNVSFKPSARKQFERLPQQIRRRMVPVIDGLAENPFPLNCEKLKGHEETYRVRMGDYRIVYEVQDEVLIVLVLAIGHRSQMYRRF